MLVRTCGIDPFCLLLKYALQTCCGTVDTTRSVLVTLPHQSQYPRFYSWTGTIVAYLNMPPFALHTAGSRLCMRFSGHNGIGRSVFQLESRSSEGSALINQGLGGQMRRLKLTPPPHPKIRFRALSKPNTRGTKSHGHARGGCRWDTRVLISYIYAVEG